MKRGLDPVVDDQSRVLVLGTLPGDESLRLKEYYSHPRNQFWSILATVYGCTVGPSYKQRLSFLRRKRLALWDILRQANRPGSLDSNIIESTPNDFVRFFRSHPRIKVVVFNGKRPHKLFRRHVVAGLPETILERLTFIEPFPSTSGSPGRYVAKLPEKVKRWKILASQ